MAKGRRIAGWIMIVAAVTLSVLTWRMLRAPVVLSDGVQCASVWQVHRDAGLVVGGFMSTAERADIASRCLAAGDVDWRRAGQLGSAAGVALVTGAAVVSASYRRSPVVVG